MDADTLKKNCAHYAGLHSKAIDVLRKANGKIDYKKIAEILSLSKTRVSSLLKSAERFGLARKEEKLYKKLPGILQHMPKRTTKKTSFRSVSEVMVGATKKASSFKRKPYIGFRTKTQDEGRMANAYIWVYITENLLRDLIRNVFSSEKDWWNKQVNGAIKKEVRDAIAKYPYDGAKRKDELEYTHLGQLKEIITSKMNWNLFLSHLNETDKNSFNATVEKAIPYRNSIAHCTRLTSEDFKFVELRFKDILKMIK
ncbi:MAG: hypothetical protein WC607_02240 [Candidatus Micrarchaeia archaeon]